MKPRVYCLALSGLFATAALAADPALVLSQGNVHSDPVGTVIEVTIQNNGGQTVGSAVVTCAFTAGGRAAGSASTNFYNVLPGASITDQVHMMGVTAQSAACQISSTGGPL